MDGRGTNISAACPRSISIRNRKPAVLVAYVYRAGRTSVDISVSTTPLVFVGIALGLTYGPQGVALGYSTALSVLLIPIAAFSKHGTQITWGDLWRATQPPFVSGVLAGGAGLLVKPRSVTSWHPFLVLIEALAVAFGAYAWVLLIIMKQKQIYLDLVFHVRARPLARHEDAEQL